MLGGSWGPDLLHPSVTSSPFFTQTQHHVRKMGACDWLLPLCFHHQIPVKTTEHRTWNQPLVNPGSGLTLGQG